MSTKKGNIVWLFGPDGAGKTTIATALAQHPSLRGNSCMFNGAHPESWPDQSFYNELLADGIDDRTHRDPDHYVNKLFRCYEMAGTLLENFELLVIDSDPRAKTILTGYVEAQQAGGSGRKELVQRYFDLGQIVGSTAARSAQQIGIHVTLDGGTTQQKGAVLLNRVKRRGVDSIFDPRDAETSTLLVRAGNDLETLLSVTGEPFIHVPTDGPLADIDAITWQLVEHI